MKIFPLLAALLAYVPVTYAQSGPTNPRIVVSGMPEDRPKPSRPREARGVVVELDVGADGRVTGTRVLEGSADAKFDDDVRKYYSRVRLMPALDAQGIAVPGTLPLGFKVSFNRTRSGGTVRNASTARPDAPEEADAPVARPAGGKPHPVYDEAGRIRRMKCQDFLWEYDFMKEIVGSGKLEPMHEQMLRTSFAMFITREKSSDDDLALLQRKFSAAVNETVTQCRQSPEAGYFTEVFVPALKSQLKG